jgi:lipoprotein NlpD
MNEGMLTLSNTRRNGAASMLLAAVLMLAACASPPNRAPVEDRSPPRAPVTTATPTMMPSPGAMPALPAGESGKVLPGAENAGKPGYYSVKPGDTMIRIGLETGQNWKDLVKWNNLDNPNVIEVGQVLRVVPPGNDAGVSTRPVAVSRVETRPLDAKPAAVAGSGTPAPAAAPAIVPTPTPAPVAAREGDDDINWLWPAAGSIASVFEEGKSKGLAIAGKPGDPILAAADGRVVYAGSGLRGYGNLVILKHNTTYLTAYAHNQTLLVKEDQSVRRGQKIAEMGSSDAERVMLHFEIRKQGKPVDPAKLLPPR